MDCKSVEEWQETAEKGIDIWKNAVGWVVLSLLPFLQLLDAEEDFEMVSTIEVTNVFTLHPQTPTTHPLQ